MTSLLVTILCVLLPAGFELTVCSRQPGRLAITEDPEVHMNTSQLITSKGYPCEEYNVHTHDGYILGIQRIPSGKTTQGQQFTTKPVVLLQHALLSCSASWVENLVNQSFGFLLADAGFDVWLGNNRGNTYAKRHEHLSPDQKEFWAFSWDEMAKFDLPAIVDKIQTVTGAQQIFYVGHSQGTEIAFAQLSRDSVFASKVKMFVALAPAVYMAHVKTPLKLLMPFAKDMEFLLENLGHGEFMPRSDILTWIGSNVCVSGEIPKLLCENIMFLIAGYDYQQMNASRIPVYIGQHPAGTSSQNMIHYIQKNPCVGRNERCPLLLFEEENTADRIMKLFQAIPFAPFDKYVKTSIESKRFQMFDFGPAENMKKYNQTTPPQYYPSNITIPVALYSGTADWLVSPEDVATLVPKIKHLVKHVVIDGWEHLDFMWAMDAPKQCYNDIIQLFKNFT